MDVFEIDPPSGHRRDPSFFLTHGAGGDRSSRDLKAMSSALAGLGHLCVRADLPYRTARRKSPPAAEKSVAGFLELFGRAGQEAGAGHRGWVAGGRSYGGRVASMAAAEGLLAAGLIFFPYPLHRPGDPSHPRTGHWPRIELPCLFIQGTKDPFCDVAVLEKELQALGSEYKLLLVEGGDHSLKVPADKAAGTKAKSQEAVAAGLAEDVSGWAEGLLR